MMAIGIMNIVGSCSSCYVTTGKKICQVPLQYITYDISWGLKSTINLNFWLNWFLHILVSEANVTRGQGTNSKQKLELIVKAPRYVIYSNRFNLNISTSRTELSIDVYPNSSLACRSIFSVCCELQCRSKISFLQHYNGNSSTSYSALPYAPLLLHSQCCLSSNYYNCCHWTDRLRSRFPIMESWQTRFLGLFVLLSWRSLYLSFIRPCSCCKILDL